MDSQLTPLLLNLPGLCLTAQHLSMFEKATVARLLSLQFLFFISAIYETAGGKTWTNKINMVPYRYSPINKHSGRSISTGPAWLYPDLFSVSLEEDWNEAFGLWSLL